MADERSLQTILDEQGRRDMWVERKVMAGHYAHWFKQFGGLADALQAANVPQASQTLMRALFEPIAQRLQQLHGQVFTP
ncbi:MAG: hypothetical protein PHC94_04820 [Methylobacter sp.]|jgi:hypothetical protein|nr:hypothetical protein [Methylococcales bacterium]MDD5113316.1 hypothetical protein [Methylobacter sp.]